MAKLRKSFTEKEWNDCCGSHCGGCRIFGKYKEIYGKKKGRKKFDRHRGKMGLPVKD